LVLYLPEKTLSYRWRGLLQKCLFGTVTKIKEQNNMIEPTDVRDLEQEGVLGECQPAVAWSAGVFDAFANAARDMRIQGLEARLGRLEEVVTSLLKPKQQT
jgi:hypothetical protein